MIAFKLLILFLGLSSLAVGANNLPAHQDNLICKVLYACTLVDIGIDDHSYHCKTSDDDEPNGESQVYDIALSEDFIAAHHTGLSQGQSYISIPHGQAIRSSFGYPLAAIEYSDDVEITIKCLLLASYLI